MLEAHYAAPMIGAVLNPINVRLDAPLIGFCLEHGEAKLLLADREFHATIAPALEKLGIEMAKLPNGTHNVKAEHGKFQTNLEHVFAAGDMRRGQSLVVWAINEGRGAARECDRYLMGETELP